MIWTKPHQEQIHIPYEEIVAETKISAFVTSQQHENKLILRSLLSIHR